MLIILDLRGVLYIFNIYHICIKQVKNNLHKTFYILY